MNKQEWGGESAPDKYKIISLVLALFIIASCLTQAILVGKGYIVYQNPHENDRFANGGAPVLDESGHELLSGTANSMPKAMTFRSAQTLDGDAPFKEVLLTATVKPDTAENKLLDWKTEFVNPSSSWATGKTVTDFVTAVPQSDGATTATVKCIKPFGSQIKVVVSSRENPAVTAECTVDFSKRITKATMDFGGKFTIQSGGAIFKTPLIDDINEDYGIPNSAVKVNLEYSDFTVDDTFEITSKHYMLDKALMAACKQQVLADFPAHPDAEAYVNSLNNEFISLVMDGSISDFTWVNLTSAWAFWENVSNKDIYNDGGFGVLDYYDSLLKGMVDTIRQKPNGWAALVVITFTGQNSTFNLTARQQFDVASLPTNSVEELTLDVTDILA